MSVASAAEAASRPNVFVALPEIAAATPVVTTCAGGEDSRLMSSRTAPRDAETRGRRDEPGRNCNPCSELAPASGGATRHTRRAKGECLGQDANDHMRLASQYQRTADDRRVSAKRPAPERVADDDHALPQITRVKYRRRPARPPERPEIRL